MEPMQIEMQYGIVVEIYNHNTSHCVLIVRSQDIKNYYYFYIPTIPQVDFGDIIEMNFLKEKFYIFRGNPRLTFKIIPSVFPGTLLWELISERINL